MAVNVRLGKEEEAMHRKGDRDDGNGHRGRGGEGEGRRGQGFLSGPCHGSYSQ